MATKPTRLQQQACDKRAQALLLITEAARLDGGKLEKDDLRLIAYRLARASSAFTLDEIVVRALEQRGRQVLRVQLGHDDDQGLRRLIQDLGTAL